MYGSDDALALVLDDKRLKFSMLTAAQFIPDDFVRSTRDGASDVATRCAFAAGKLGFRALP